MNMNSSRLQWVIGLLTIISLALISFGSTIKETIPELKDAFIPNSKQETKVDYFELKFVSTNETQSSLVNPWSGPITVEVVGKENSKEQVDGGTIYEIQELKNGDLIRIKETTPDVTFRTWKPASAASPLLRGGEWEVTSMPTMDHFTTDKEGTIAGDAFFQRFNENGSITKFPEGSLDTSKITKVGNSFFAEFSAGSSMLKSLPKGSFDTSNIKTAGDSFFGSFVANESGTKKGMTSLPDGSFRLNNLKEVGTDAFSAFNLNGSLTSLPKGSFNTGSIKGFKQSFFWGFNRNGDLTSLPEGSFKLEGPFLSSNDTTLFFSSFNSEGALTSLPEGSFSLNDITGAVGDYFFSEFNRDGQLTNLPEGSFNTSGITSMGVDFFSFFDVAR